MSTVVSRMTGFLVTEDGPTATEYAIMLALIIVVSLAAISLLGDSVAAVFGHVDTNLPE